MVAERQANRLAYVSAKEEVLRYLDRGRGSVRGRSASANWGDIALGRFTQLPRQRRISGECLIEPTVLAAAAMKRRYRAHQVFGGAIGLRMVARSGQTRSSGAASSRCAWFTSHFQLDDRRIGPPGS